MDFDFPTHLQAGRRLAGKVAIVSGGGSSGEGTGIGDTISRLFARDGASVAVLDIARDKAQRTVDAIEAAGGAGFAVVADVTSTADCEKAVAETVERYGRLDTLVNNVGMSGGNGPLTDLEEDVWERVCRMNLKSAVFMSKYAIPHLAAAGGGSIVNISSISGILSLGSTVYGPTKAAMIAFTRDVALLHGAQGVRCNSIAPGHLYTAFIAGRFTDAQRARRREIAPLRNLEGNGWDVAAAALFLASDEARFITGVSLPVDGGVTQVGALAAANRL